MLFRSFNLDAILAFASKLQKEALSGQVDMFAALGGDKLMPSIELKTAPVKHTPKEQLDNILDIIGRLHSAEEAEKCYELTREAGFQNINLDTMFALPGQDMTVWRDTVEKVIKMRPEHISFYSDRDRKSVV